jgi:hypothetical protein
VAGHSANPTRDPAGSLTRVIVRPSAFWSPWLGAIVQVSGGVRGACLPFGVSAWADNRLGVGHLMHKCGGDQRPLSALLRPIAINDSYVLEMVGERRFRSLERRLPSGPGDRRRVTDDKGVQR